MYRYDFRLLRDNLAGRSGGKGATFSEARAVALCEGLERYSGIWHGEEPAFSAAAADLQDGIDLFSALGFSDKQYAGRDEWNSQNDEPHAWVPKRLDSQLVIDWVPTWSLTGERTRYLPAALAYYGHPDLRHMFCASDSNGCAAGASLCEAAVHGLLELIERDSVAIWWYNRVARPAIDLDSVASSQVDELRERYLRIGRDLWALDLTTDTGIPVVAAVSALAHSGSEGIFYGFGADVNPSVAAIKAVLEMNQSHYSAEVVPVGGARRYRTDRSATLRWLRTATLESERYLVPDPRQQPRRLPALSNTPEANWLDDARTCIGRLQTLGLETLILDQTRPDIGMPVCRVTVPGLCHFWRRLGHRRLFEVPVKLGWSSVALSEDDANPWCVYF